MDTPNASASLRDFAASVAQALALIRAKADEVGASPAAAELGRVAAGLDAVSEGLRRGGEAMAAFDRGLAASGAAGLAAASPAAHPAPPLPTTVTAPTSRTPAAPVHAAAGHAARPPIAPAQPSPATPGPASAPPRGRATLPAWVGVQPPAVPPLAAVPTPVAAPAQPTSAPRQGASPSPSDLLAAAVARLHAAASRGPNARSSPVPASPLAPPRAPAASASPPSPTAAHAAPRTDFQAEARALKECVRLAEARARALSSPHVERALTRQLALLRESGRSGSSSPSAPPLLPPPANQSGGEAEAEGKRRRESQEQMRAMASHTSMLASSLVGVGGGLVSVAGQFSAWPTFTNSVKQLQVAVGAELVPVLDTLSGGVQSATRWLDSLSPGAKRFAANSAIMTAGAIAGAAAMLRLAAGARVALGAMSALMMNPMALAIAGVGAGVGLLASRWLAVRDSAEQARVAMEGAGRFQAGAGGAEGRPRQFAPQDMENLDEPDRRAVAAASQRGPQAAIDELNTRRRAAGAAAEAMRAQQAGHAGAMSDIGRMTQQLNEYRQERQIAHFGRAYADERDIPQGRTAEQREARLRYGSEIDERMRQQMPRMMAAYRTMGVANPQVTNLRDMYDTARMTRGAAGGDLAAAERRVGSLQLVLDRLGSGANQGMMQSFAGQAPRIFSDSMQLADALQIQALKGDELEDDIQRRQLQAAERSNQLVEQLIQATRDQARNRIPEFRY